MSWNVQFSSQRKYHNATNAFTSIELVSCRWRILLISCLELATLSLICRLIGVFDFIWTILSSKNVRHASIGSTAVRNSRFTPGRFRTTFWGACRTVWVGFSVVQLIDLVTFFPFFSNRTATFSMETWE